MLKNEYAVTCFTLMTFAVTVPDTYRLYLIPNLIKDSAPFPVPPIVMGKYRE